MNLVEPGKCYRIGGRLPLIPVRIEYGTGKRIRVTAYTPHRYSRYLKFNVYDPKTQKTLAELEGIQPPAQTHFRYNSTSKVEELDIKKYVPDWDLLHPTLSIDGIDRLLKLPRQ